MVAKEGKQNKVMQFRVWVGGSAAQLCGSVEDQFRPIQGL